MTEDQIVSAIEDVVRKYNRELIGIHVWAFVQAHLMIFGLGGALWLLHHFLIK